MNRRPRSPRPRRGVTLVELMIGVVLAVIVSAAVVRMLTSQQRFYIRAAQMLERRSNVRQAIALLPSELAAVTPSEGEMVAVLDTAIEFRSTIGAGVVCTVAAAGTGRTFVVAPTRADASSLSGWTSPPQIGDTLAVLNDSTGIYQHVAVTAVDSSATICSAGTFSAAPAGTMRYRINVAEALSPAYGVGSPLRVTRRVRYSLYQSPTDSKWYLGRRVQQAGINGAMGAMQMVSGPYSPAAANGAGGLIIRYFDKSGTVVPAASPSLTARVDIAVRGDSARLSTGTVAGETDSVSVSLRNRF